MASGIVSPRLLPGRTGPVGRRLDRSWPSLTARRRPSTATASGLAPAIGLRATAFLRNGLTANQRNRGTYERIIRLRGGPDAIRQVRWIVGGSTSRRPGRD